MPVQVKGYSSDEPIVYPTADDWTVTDKTLDVIESADGQEKRIVASHWHGTWTTVTAVDEVDEDEDESDEDLD